MPGLTAAPKPAQSLFCSNRYHWACGGSAGSTGPGGTQASEPPSFAPLPLAGSSPLGPTLLPDRDCPGAASVDTVAVDVVAEAADGGAATGGGALQAPISSRATATPDNDNTRAFALHSVVTFPPPPAPTTIHVHCPVNGRSGLPLNLNYPQSDGGGKEQNWWYCQAWAGNGDGRCEGRSRHPVPPMSHRGATVKP